MQPLGQAVPGSFVTQSCLWPSHKPPHPFSTHLPCAPVCSRRQSPCSFSACSPCPQVHLWIEVSPVRPTWVSLFTYQCFPVDQELLRAETVIFVYLQRHSLAHYSRWIIFWMVKWYKGGFPFADCHSPCWLWDSVTESRGIPWSYVLFKSLMIT